MITIEEIGKLAELSRIKIDENEKQDLRKEIDSILNYIDQIKKATLNIDHTPTIGVVNNIFREDIFINTSPEDREKILSEAPHRRGDFITVKKIISQEE